MKYFITGSAGFIGANFVYFLLREQPDCTMICIDSLTYAGNLATLDDAAKDERFSFVRADITDRNMMNRLFKEHSPDIVVNFAAESHVDRSIENPTVFLMTNVIGVQVLLDACREFGVTRFHQVSTDEVYGDLPLDRPDLLFTEQIPINPSSPYSASKASADLLVMAYCRTFGVPATISRCSNNYGPYQFPEKLIPLMITRALEDQDLPIYGIGRNVRDWIYVDDHCAAIGAILQNGVTGEVYNVGGHSERENITVVNTILKLLGKPSSLIKYVTDRPGHDLRYAIDSSKIEKALGWKPEWNFERGMECTVKWYLENREWTQSIIGGEYRDYYERVYLKR